MAQKRIPKRSYFDPTPFIPSKLSPWSVNPLKGLGHRDEPFWIEHGVTDSNDHFRVNLQPTTLSKYTHPKRGWSRIVRFRLYVDVLCGHFFSVWTRRVFILK